MRLAVYNDLTYRRDGDALYGDEAFVIFLGALAGRFDELVLLGRLDPRPGRSRFPVPGAPELVALPHYPSLSRPLPVAAAVAGSLVRCWRTLGRVDAIWLLGPHPLALAFALLAAVRGKRIVLGVRQDFPSYVRTRHPGRRSLLLAADALEWAWRTLARRCPTAVVGSDLARSYRGARELLPIAISLVPEQRVVGAAANARRSYDGELQALSVGRLDPEKNPLLMAEVLALLAEDGPRWRLVVCGEGTLADELARAAAARGLEDRIELRGYVPVGGGLDYLYEESHALLHVSWTEGVPQVLIEAFAAGLPVVATAVGGVAEAAGDAALLVPPGDAPAAAASLRRVADEPALRRRLVEDGEQRARERTLESQTGLLAAWIQRSTRRRRHRTSGQSSSG